MSLRTNNMKKALYAVFLCLVIVCTLIIQPVPEVQAADATTTAAITTTKWKFSSTGFKSLGTISSNKTVSKLKLLATKSKPMSVKSGKVTYKDTTYTKYLALSGAGSTKYRAVSFDVSNNSKITITAKSATSTTRYLVICNEKGKQLSKQKITKSVSAKSYTYTGDAAKVYVYSTKGDINLYQIKVTTPQETQTKTDDANNNKSEDTTTFSYNKMIANSLISTGNNYRIKNAMEKAQNGEDVTIAYIGGSITEGAGASVNKNCYAYQSYLKFKETYGNGDGSNVNFVNAGMSGTPSSLGVIRYERDVLKRAATAPDIVFVEFAVNDGDDVTNGNTYESLVRNILTAENQPAVILLFSVFQSQWNLQDRFKPIGTAYNLPMVSIKNAIVPEINQKNLTNADFFSSDTLHPNDKGHKIMSDCVTYLFDQIAKETKADKDITVPSSPVIGNSFEGIQMIDSNSKIDGVAVKAGCFSTKDTMTGNFLCDFTSKFANTWKHAANATGDSFKMELTCKNILFVYKLSNAATAGKAEVYVDGKLVTTANSYSSGGWNNPNTIVILNETTAAKHTIEIKMADEDVAKEFTILGFGFTK